MNASPSIEIGEVFMVQVHGPEQTVMFKASLALSCAAEMTFNVHPPMTSVPATEAARFSVSGMDGEILYDGIRVAVDVLDISQGGVGLLCQQVVTRYAKVTVVISSPYGPITTTGEIRYCRPDQETLGSYRVGIRLDEMGRLERARWNRLFEMDLV
jgi:hypothetical protein